MVAYMVQVLVIQEAYISSIYLSGVGRKWKRMLLFILSDRPSILTRPPSLLTLLKPTQICSLLSLSKNIVKGMAVFPATLTKTFTYNLYRKKSECDRFIV